MKRIAICTVGLLLFFSLQPLLSEAVTSDPMDRFKQYMNRMVTEVKKTDDPNEKRALLDESLNKMKQAAERVKQMRGVDAEDRESLAALSAHFSDKLDQLHGENGYDYVADANLDRFANYVQQDMEQARRTVVLTISATTLALLVLVLLLI